MKLRGLSVQGSLTCLWGKLMNQKVELLAPAGNTDGFYGAIKAGADAIYLGGNRFGARAYADNFTTEELTECIRYAHLFDRKVYLTVNTLMKEEELPELASYLRPFYEAGLDGVIVQDIGALDFIKEYFPGMELHISTQMTVTGEYGVRLLQHMGAVRVVPARELSLKELKAIKERTGVDLETFIHGAMCYCYSGQCLFSSILGGRSGNRGRCAQPCRLPYQAQLGQKHYKECYPLSLKDMCTIRHLPELIEAGIDSFKIEGRMKKPEYAAGVTAVYRKYIDRYYAGERTPVSEADSALLAGLYVRSQVQDGYYFRQNGRDMVTLDNPSYSRNDEARLEEIRQKYLQEKLKIRLHIEAVFLVGQPARVTFSRVDCPQQKVTVVGDEVMAATKTPIAEENIRKQLSKLGDTAFEADRLIIQAPPNAFYPLKAINELRRRACRELEEAILNHNGTPSGRVCRDLGQVPEGQKQKAVFVSDQSSQPGGSNQKGNYHILVSTAQQLEAFYDLSIRRFAPLSVSELLVEADLLRNLSMGSTGSADSADGINSINSMNNINFMDSMDRLRKIKEQGCALRLALPYILRDGDLDFLEKIWQFYQNEKSLFDGFLVRSYDGLGFLRSKADAQTSVAGDAGLYVWNSRAVDALQLDRFCLPYELKAAEQHRILEKASAAAEKVVYGRIPLMVTANCIQRTMDRCTKSSFEKSPQKEPIFLKDRYQKLFPVQKNCMHCYNIIYNSLPLFLHKGLNKWSVLVDFRINFTVESYEETQRILRYFLDGATQTPPVTEYTTGHEKRGVE